MILLARHTAVARHWQRTCYGQSDVGLSRVGAAHAASLAPVLADWRPDIVIHSGLKRTRVLADKVAAQAGVASEIRPDWRERDFGDWEGRGWHAIHRLTGNAMDGMIDDPNGFRPGGGETTAELGRRIMKALAALPLVRVVVVTHGGPIAAAIGLSRSLPIAEWIRHVPAPGGYVEIAHRGGWAPDIWPLL